MPQNTAADDTAGDAAEVEIDKLREEIDWLDAEILRLVKRRVEVSKTIGAARMAAGGPRIVYNREIDVLARYRELGTEGRRLAMALLNLGRGPLGR
ncbi:chorismate mutase [Actinophytocola gossypii]|uniref:Chorismate mutase n=1 Tax=Actinophytocola gossypii TaxID=2812003 RepID=A0ABT2JKA0_9PSEU|nr:chorismate mutase [Actinophytocola gossypii]MCT2588131.1 chorismate mutase [Actinophytocola gossypii]